MAVLERETDHERRSARARELLDDLPYVAALALEDRAERERAIKLLTKRTSVTKAAVEERLQAFERATEGQDSDEGQGQDGSTHPAVDSVSLEAGWLCATGHRGKPLRLANFDARIEAEVTHDDGVDRRKRYRITGSLLATGEALEAVEVPAADFSAMKWVHPAWGARAVVGAGPGVGDRLRETIQLRSTPTRETVYSHLGFRKVDGVWTYLDVGGSASSVAARVEVPHDLRRFQLIRSTATAADALRASIGILACAPLAITVPLLGAVYAALLASILPIDVVLWLFGQSGTRKSSLAAIAQAHYGSAMIDRRNLPCSWTSTANALEETTFLAKDALVVCDDYAPASSAAARQEQDAKVERIVRNAGNRAGRQRMLADLSLAPAHPPRCLLLSTGEDAPRIASIRARTLLVEVQDVDLNALSAVQRYPELLPHALAEVVASICGHYDAWVAYARSQQAEATRNLSARLGPKAHSRTAGNVAQLYVGILLVSDVANQAGALDAAERDRLRNDAFEALVAVGRRQASLAEDESPAEQYVRTLSGLLASGALWLAPRSASVAAEPPRGARTVGWRDDEWGYVLPTVAWEEVSRALKVSGAGLPVSPRMLYQEMLAREWLVADPDGKHQGRVLNVGGKSKRVLKLPIEVLEGAPGSDAERIEPGPSTTSTSSTVEGRSTDQCDVRDDAVRTRWQRCLARDSPTS
ncbi:MAG: DUF927 domain-containing protein [Deltaproteobacteria bacterium]|nr:DUF927 domain-containing protein [Deltaproteobacteria bacterium]